jgi:acyl-CoA synthetase (AMP-forming)/AMP-acid ligase II
MKDPADLCELLDARAADNPSGLAYTFLPDGEEEGATLTWGDLDRQSRLLAARLVRSCSPGDRVLLVFPAGPDFIVGFFACLRAGLIAVPVAGPAGSRASHGVDRLRSIASDARPSVVLSSREGLQRWGGVLAGTLPSLPLLAVDDPGIDATDTGSFGAAPSALAFLQYTSGSTASPRGVMVTHANVLHNLRCGFEGAGTPRGAPSVSWLPHTHDMGLIEGILQPVYGGGPAYLMPPAAFVQRPVRWLRAISRYRGQRSGGPDFAYDLARSRTTTGDRRSLDLSSWTTAFNGAEPIRSETLDAFARAFAPCGFRASSLVACYGLAEATLLVSNRRWDGAQGSAIPCGDPIADTSLRIVDPENGGACRDGVIGEIQVSGPGVAAGYWGQPELTRKTFVVDPATGCRWLRTGDLGSRTDRGVVVSSRLKDVLIVRGAKHFPQDLEHTAQRLHPAIRPGSVAVVAVARAVEGDLLALVAEADPRTLDPAEHEPLITRLRSAIAEAHGVQLHGVALVAPGQVPRTPSGKLQRFLCRETWLRNGFTTLAIWMARPLLANTA